MQDEAVIGPAGPQASRDGTAFMALSWADVEPHYRDLQSLSLTTETVGDFLADWSELAARVDETDKQLSLAADRDTSDEEAAERYRAFLDGLHQQAQAADQRLKEKLLRSGLRPPGYEVPLRAMQAETALFREENLPLSSEETKLGEEYNKLFGSQTVQWEGEEIPVSQLRPRLLEPDRALRERAWQIGAERRLADRDSINDLWQRLLSVRRRLASNADLPDYRAFRWQQLRRFDYTPDDCLRFQRAIEEVVVPAATRIYEKRRTLLGVKSLRPWDLEVDPSGQPALRPFETAGELQSGTSAIFHRLDPRLGGYFDTMVSEQLLDLEGRKNKAPGGYCTLFAAQGKPFIFMSGSGTHDDVETLAHESGHAFHIFEMSRLQFFQQLRIGMGLEFKEVASMTMELLTAPYLSSAEGGFYDERDAARARVDNLEVWITLWPRIALVDAFQHWIYENPDTANDPSSCDARWMELRRRYVPGVDWSGLEQELMTGWHDVLHIFQVPFYYVEYGLAQLGAAQIWANALRNESEAVERYLHALSLGGTRSIPELYAAAGAKFAFDAGTLRDALGLMEETMAALQES